MSECISDDPTSHPQQLRSMEFVENAIQTEVKEIKQRRKEARLRGLTDITLMLLMIMITVLASVYMM